MVGFNPYLITLFYSDFKPTVFTEIILYSLMAYNHKENEHKPLKKVQIQELDTLLIRFEAFQKRVAEILASEDWGAYAEIQEQKRALFQCIEERFASQSQRVAQGEVSARNNTVFLEILLEMKDLISISGRFVKILGTAPPEKALDGQPILHQPESPQSPA